MGEPLCAVGAAVSFLALRPLNWGVEAAAAVFFFFFSACLQVGSKRCEGQHF